MTLYTVRFHGRGGQLLEEASRALASAFMAENWFVQLSPDAITWRDRVGLPRTMFLKIGKTEFTSGSRVLAPHCVVIFDENLLRVADVYAGIRKEGVVVINSTNVGSALNIELDVARVVSVDADEIAARVYGSETFPKVGPAMLGAFVKGFGKLQLASVKDAVEVHFPRGTKEHITAVEIAYEEACARTLSNRL